MTYREYISTIGQRFGLSDADIDIILIDQSAIIPDPESQVDARVAKRALCKSFATMLPIANVSQGGYSLSWNVEGLKMWYEMTCSELNIPSRLKPTVKNKSNIW